MSTIAVGKRRGQMIGIDLSDWKTDMTYDDCLKLCVELGLLETIVHGPHDYGRVTQKGINVMQTLITMAGNSAFPENKLDVS